MFTLVSVPAGQPQHGMSTSAFRPYYSAHLQNVFCETNMCFPQKINCKTRVFPCSLLKVALLG